MRVLEQAETIAEEVLFPAALAVDGADRVPPSHLDLLADRGIYGLAGPRDAGGLAASPAQAARVVEALAGGCLATTFVWLQHGSALRAVAGSTTPGLRDGWLGPLCRGERRAGIAQAALRSGPPAVRARPVDGGFLLSGAAPWVTGWGMFDVLYVAARDATDTVLWFLLDAVAGPALQVEPLHLVAVNASRTVLVHFTDHFVPASRLVTTAAHQGGQPASPMALRANGSLSLGVASRCARLLDSADLARDVDQARQALDGALDASEDEMPKARAAASALALHAATQLTLATGAASVLSDSHAQRLFREAMFLLVFGSRPPIRAALAQILGVSSGGGSR
jgi:alkylation response protein AidB-like acyl-CoA dehydrogenase